jgi:glutathione-independent formaldehyde dehydrogenase
MEPMKAVVYEGTRRVGVHEVEDATLEDPADVVVRVTSSAVSLVKPGDRVVIPTHLYCGMCFNCVRGYTAACLRVRPGGFGAAYGYAGLGPYRGAQAELLRVPFADANCIRVPGSPRDELEDDFVLLADAFVTGWHATELAFMQPGCTVAVFGAGTIGLLAAYSALLRGAAEVYVVDHVAERLDMAGALGATPVSFGDGDPVEQCDLMPLHVRQLEADAAGLGCARP